MPSYKFHLTQKEQAKYLAVAEELSAGGLPLEIPEEWRGNGPALLIEIGGPPVSSIYQREGGIVAYIIRVKLVALRGGVILEDFKITPAWDPDVYPCHSYENPGYRLDACLENDRKEVLNHRIESHLRFRRGDLVDGWLLATGFKPIPPEYRPGTAAPLDIAFLDQFGVEHRVMGAAVVERSAKILEPGARPRSELFERLDRDESTERDKGKGSQWPAGPQILENVENMQMGAENEPERCSI